jgi:hypothetical protein
VENSVYLSCVLAIFSRLKSWDNGLGIVSSEAKIGLGKAQAKLFQQITLIKLFVYFMFLLSRYFGDAASTRFSGGK